MYHTLIEALVRWIRSFDFNAKTMFTTFLSLLVASSREKRRFYSIKTNLHEKKNRDPISNSQGETFYPSIRGGPCHRFFTTL